MRRSSRAIAIAAALVGVGLALGTADEPGLREDPEPAREAQNNIFDGGDPLGNGDEITLGELAEATEACNVCVLPESGSAGAQAMRHAWARSDGKIAVDFEGGLRIYFTPQLRSNDRYLADTADLLDSDLYEVIELRDLKLLARHGSDATRTPPAMLWVEDGYLVEMIGHGGQRLEDLIPAAETLGGSPGSA